VIFNYLANFYTINVLTLSGDFGKHWKQMPSKSPC